MIDLRRLSSVIDFFIIATSESSRQTKAITENIESALKQKRQKVWHVEGLNPLRSQRSRLRRRTHFKPSASGADSTSFQSSSHEEDMSWVLMDCGDVVIHVLNPPARQFYQIERLWGDAPRLPIDSLS